MRDTARNRREMQRHGMRLGRIADGLEEVLREERDDLLRMSSDGTDAEELDAQREMVSALDAAVGHTRYAARRLQGHLRGTVTGGDLS